jgi:hypothetical protein
MLDPNKYVRIESPMPVISALSPSQDTQADQLRYGMGWVGIPFVRHAPLPPSGMSQHTALAKAVSQTLAAKAIYGVNRNINQIAQSTIQQPVSLDIVHDGINFNKVLATPATGLNTLAAVDNKGNLKLKNITSPTPVTNTPTTTSATYVVVPEMTSTVTTHGNPVLVTFTVRIFGGATVNGNLALFRDSSNLTGDHPVVLTTSSNDTDFTLTIIDIGATAGSHVFSAQWKTSNSMTASALLRTLQVVELG